MNYIGHKIISNDREANVMEFVAPLDIKRMQR
jgi:hypothetical protein